MPIPKIYESREALFDLYRSHPDAHSASDYPADDPFMRVAEDLTDDPEESIKDLMDWPAFMHVCEGDILQNSRREEYRVVQWRDGRSLVIARCVSITEKDKGEWKRRLEVPGEVPMMQHFELDQLKAGDSLFHRDSHDRFVVTLAGYPEAVIAMHTPEIKRLDGWVVKLPE